MTHPDSKLIRIRKMLIMFIRNESNRERASALNSLLILINIELEIPANSTEEI